MNTATHNTSTLTLTDAATALIKSDVRAFKSDGKRYAAYVTEMSVTADTVAAHVALFRDEFKAMTKGATPDQIKAYATKVRNGLNYHVSGPRTPKVATALLTSLGVHATLEQVTEAWKAAQV